MAITAAGQLKTDGIVKISLGLDSVYVKMAQLESVASSEGHVVIPKSSSDDSAINSLISMICAGKENNVNNVRVKVFKIEAIENRNTLALMSSRFLTYQSTGKKTFVIELHVRLIYC